MEEGEEDEGRGEGEKGGTEGGGGGEWRRMKLQETNGRGGHGGRP